MKTRRVKTDAKRITGLARTKQGLLVFTANETLIARSPSRLERLRRFFRR